MTIISLRREHPGPYLLVNFAESPLVIARFFNRQSIMPNGYPAQKYGSGIVMHEETFKRLFKLKLKRLP